MKEAKRSLKERKKQIAIILFGMLLNILFSGNIRRIEENLK